mmetsp:Transcript_7484/g.26154  ORF Transcript_7484/g.26154 Transcript_7484/m.26154 type:complete len:83 (+) Transcript_7484:341-589(+)
MASEDNTARLWDAATGELQATLEGHSDCVTSCVFSPDGKRVVTGSYDKTATMQASARPRPRQAPARMLAETLPSKAWMTASS